MDLPSKRIRSVRNSHTIGRWTRRSLRPPVRLLAKLDGRVVSSHTEFLPKECLSNRRAKKSCMLLV